MSHDGRASGFIVDIGQIELIIQFIIIVQKWK